MQMIVRMHARRLTIVHVDNNSLQGQESLVMSTVNDLTANGGVARVVRRMLTERSIAHSVAADADLREAGLTSLNMVELVLSVEFEFDLQIPAGPDHARQFPLDLGDRRTGCGAAHHPPLIAR